MTAVDTASHGPLAGRRIVCVGFNDWETDVWTNQHHLMARLAVDNRVLFVESLGLRRPTLAGRDVRRMIRRVARGLAGPRRVPVPGRGAAVDILSPLVVPAHSSELARQINRWLLPRLVGNAARGLGADAPILWAYVPQAELLLDRLAPGLVIYHCVDDISAHPRIDTDSFRAAERRFAARADLVFASSPPLAERMRELSPNVHYMPNVADIGLFASALAPGPVDPEIARLPEPRIVFTGAIAATKLDVSLLVELARRRPDWSIVLVGPIGLGDPLGDLSALTDSANIHILAARPYDALPAVLRGAQAAVIPYLLNELTRSVFPMKVYEYLAAGLATVATPLPSLVDTEGIAFATDAREFERALDAAVREDGPVARAQRARLADGHGWDNRLREISDLIERTEAR